MTETKSVYGRNGRGLKVRITKGHKKPFKDDEYVHYLNCGNSFTGGYIFQTYQIGRSKYMQPCVNHSTIKLYFENGSHPNKLTIGTEKERFTYVNHSNTR